MKNKRWYVVLLAGMLVTAGCGRDEERSDEGGPRVAPAGESPIPATRAPGAQSTPVPGVTTEPGAGALPSPSSTHGGSLDASARPYHLPMPGEGGKQMAQ